jgi:hyperosmotically inducible periplasmic protein
MRDSVAMMRTVAGLSLIALCVLSACVRGPNPPRGTVGISLDDARIAASVRSAILNDPALGLRDIAVEVSRGVVVLSGTVSTEDEAQRAARAARGATGVRDVKSALKVGS